MKTYPPLAAMAADFIAYRRLLGYQDRRPERILGQLTAFMDHADPDAPLSDALLMAWRASRPGQPMGDLHCLVKFVEWLRPRDPRTRVSDLWFQRSGRQRPAPYIFDTAETDRLMAATLAEPPRYGVFRLHTYQALLGLQISTGLRIGESLRLDRGDVDLDDSLLKIRESKGVPLRVIPVHETTAAALAKYARLRDAHHHVPATPAFFVGPGGRRLHYIVFRLFFVRLMRKVGVPFRNHSRSPRLHDLRHTFASRHLLRHRQENRDIDCAVADLSVYLGHKNIADTYWYLTGLPELMALCGERFRKYAEERRRGGRA